MTEPTNEALAKAILVQQEQVRKLSELVSSLSAAGAAQSQAHLELQQQLVGFHAAFQIFAELVMASSETFKQQVAAATDQILARPDAANNETLRDLLSSLNKAAKSPSRATPEGRRANLQIVPVDEGDNGGEV